MSLTRIKIHKVKTDRTTRRSRQVHNYIQRFQHRSQQSIKEEEHRLNNTINKLYLSIISKKNPNQKKYVLYILLLFYTYSMYSTHFFYLFIFRDMVREGEREKHQSVRETLIGSLSYAPSPGTCL